MNQTFTTAKTLANVIEIAGWMVCISAVLGTALIWGSSDNPSGTSALIYLGSGAVGAASGLGLVLAAQLVQAQVATAINTGRIVQQLAQPPLQTERPHLAPIHVPSASAPRTPSPAPLPSYSSDPHAEGRFLRMYKGFELHKYSDGISVNGEGRYPTILEAEKRATELAASGQAS